MRKVILLLILISLSLPLGSATAALAQVPAQPRFETTAPANTQDDNLLNKDWVDPNTGIDIRQNMWNCPSTNPPCGAQTLWANSSSNWGVVSDQAKGNTAVMVYPDAQNVYTLPSGDPDPLKNFGIIQSTFKERSPSVGDFEAAYDLWLNNWNTEVMIWVDNHGQTPAGNVVGTTTIYGQRFTVWSSAGQSGGYPSGPFTFVLNKNEKGGRVHILSAFRVLEEMKLIPATSSLDDIEFGWEICSTGGHPENFEVTSYSDIAG
jgi:hypothetical protein